ncbi:MAG TPA: DUF4913 domain-containing protein [Mycobacterium sp.]
MTNHPDDHHDADPGWPVERTDRHGRDPSRRRSFDAPRRSERGHRPPANTTCRSNDSDTPADEFDALPVFVDAWLAPTIARRLGDRGQGSTWCPQWWRHRETSMRLSAAWRAWETARVDGGNAMSSWWVHHLDPHLRVVMDAEHGPMYRCSPARHQHMPPLPVTPVPDGWFGHGLDPDPHTRRRHATSTTVTDTEPPNAAGEVDDAESPRDEFGSFVEFVEVLFAPTIARRLTAAGQGRTWCRQWWRHQEPASRLHALWRAWEAARTRGGTALSTWWLSDADAHLRLLLDGHTGPLYRCTPARHQPTEPLPLTRVPAGWFDLDPPDPTRSYAFGGFGPDLRLDHDTTPPSATDIGRGA